MSGTYLTPCPVCGLALRPSGQPWGRYSPMSMLPEDYCVDESHAGATWAEPRHMPEPGDPDWDPHSPESLITDLTPADARAIVERALLRLLYQPGWEGVPNSGSEPSPDIAMREVIIRSALWTLNKVELGATNPSLSHLLDIMDARWRRAL